MAYVLGIDLGTSSLKGILVAEDGQVVATASSDYSIERPSRGYSEQDPEEWVKACLTVIKNITQQIPDAIHKIEGISFSGQMHSLVLIDEQGLPLRNAILWNDVRTTAQCERITDELGENLIRITKNKALEGFTLSKILWVQENEPTIWSKTKHFLLPKDYLRYRLTGELGMDYSDAAGTLLLDIEQNEWSTAILDQFDIDPAICPPLVQSTEKVGYVLEEIAQELGITNDIPVFAGGADNACGALGAGIVHANQGMASIGTSGVFLSNEETNEKDYQGHLHFFNHVIPNRYYSMGVTLAAGNSLSWYKDTFADDQSYEELLSGIDEIEAGSDGLIFAPYLSGERTPYTDSDIRGTFLGIDINHSQNHFTRAVLEGITFSLRDSLELMKTYTDKTIEQVVSVGGGAKNKEWLQMQADIFNTPVTPLETEQGPGMGAAMLAAVGTGWFSDLADCSKVFVNYKEPIQPSAQEVKKYNEVYKIYQTVYPAIKEISHQLVNR